MGPNIYEADLDAATLTGDAQGLACALRKLEIYQRGWFGRVFLPGRQTPEPSLLRTHPATEERVRRLLALEASHPHYLEPSQFVPNSLLVHGSLPRVLRSPRWHLHGIWY